MPINKLVVSLPLNTLSLGQVSYNILREIYARKIQCVVFPKGNVDLSAYKTDQPFMSWLERSVNDRLKKFDRTIPTLSCWHLNGSEFKPTDRQYLFSFHETDSPTEFETNIANQQEKVFFSSNWSVDNFTQYGANNVSYIPLGLDKDFYTLPGRAVSSDITHWILVGKAEQRKNTQLIIQQWVKKYGNNKAHQLTLCITNPFFQPEHMNAFYAACFENKLKPFNVNPLPHLKTNAEMNQLYNSADIDLSGFSSSEGWNIPAFTATALGKWSVVTNCTAHKDWANDQNSILVEATEMRPVYDGVFFQQGGAFSQGNIYSLKAEQLQLAFEKAEKLAKTPNADGKKLAQDFTYAKTVDKILEKMV